MKIVVMGPQGSGKGTQAERIVKEYKIPHISTGDILRKNIADKTPLGKTAKLHIDKGELVPDAVVNDMVQERLGKKDCKKGYLLDGYPRTLNQAKALERYDKVEKVFLLEVPDEVSVRRLSARRQCSKCGKIFGIDIPPKREGVCDSCKGRLFQRDDDMPEKINTRLKEYHKETEPLVGFYGKRIVRLDGTKPIDAVFKEIAKVLEGLR